MNSPFVVEQADVMASRIRGEVGPEPLAQFQRAWRLAYGRPPTDREMAYGLAFLTVQTSTPTASAPANPKTPPVDPSHVALAHLCQALISSNGFLYVD